MKISDLKEIGGSEIDPSMFKTYTPPTYVGGYRIGKELTGSIQFNLTYKPNFIHRFFMKICLGWYWFDQK
jgi:hypothetical protein